MRLARWSLLVVLSFSGGCDCARSPSSVSSPTPVSVPPGTQEPGAVLRSETTSSQDAWHLVSRLSLGPTPAAIDQVQTSGLDAWLEQQLYPPPDNEEAVQAALERYSDLFGTPTEVLDAFQRTYDKGENEIADDPRMTDVSSRSVRDKLQLLNAAKLISMIQMTELSQHILSSYQLKEVMVDFWTNHFNVFARKGIIKVLAVQWLQQVIRRHALGNFQELLIATARHPAMLVYLDNVGSKVLQDNPAASVPNENYARELMELHTLGVDAGYTQQDVIETARIFTGWGIRPIHRGEPEFRFRSQWHDPGTKTVLGKEFGGGELEGLELLRFLATHPKTASRIATKLCARLVADIPPPGCIAAATDAFVEHRGDIRQVLRAVVHDESFWAPGVRGNKFKTPLEFLVSAARTVGARPANEDRLNNQLRRLGQPLLQESQPTGYPESEAEWLSASGMLSRFEFAFALASRNQAGLHYDDAALFGSADTTTELLDVARRRFFGGNDAVASLEAIGVELDGLKGDRQRKRALLILSLSSREFQYQ